MRDFIRDQFDNLCDFYSFVPTDLRTEDSANRTRAVLATTSLVHNKDSLREPPPELILALIFDYRKGESWVLVLDVQIAATFFVEIF